MTKYFQVLLEQSFLQSLVQQSLRGIKTVNVIEAFGLQIVGNVSRPSSNINDFRILAHIGKLEEIVNQAIRISISHNFLANFSREIFQILNQTQKCKDYVILQHFVLRECLNVKVLTVGQWSNNLVLYSVLLQDPNKYMMMKFWKFISLPPFSKWSMYPRQILSIFRIMAEWTVFCSDILLFEKKIVSFWAISIISSYLHFIPKVQTQLKILVFQGSLKKITAATPAFSSKTTHVSNFGGHLLLAQKYRQKIK